MDRNSLKGNFFMRFGFSDRWIDIAQGVKKKTMQILCEMERLELQKSVK